MDRTYVERRITTKNGHIEGKMMGRRTRGRPRQMMLDWMMTDGSYKQLKEEAQQREEWRRRTFEPADEAEH